MSKNDGGPAFPVTINGTETYGLSIRDYFAAKAMQGILSDKNTVSAFDEAGSRELLRPECLVATASYAMADAMLSERAK